MGTGSFETRKGQILFYVLIVLFIMMTTFPLLWIVKMSIISQSELDATPPTILPHTFDLHSFETVFGEDRFVSGLRNTVIIAGTTTVICLSVGSIAAYSLARLKFALQKPVLSLILAVAFFPAVAILGPLFLMFDSAGITDTYQAMIIPDILFALPLTVYLLVAYFRELPLDLEEAAKVDGASPLQAFFRVTLPLSIPGVATTGILTFIFAATEFLFANTFAFTSETQPATVIIPQFATQFVTDYGAQAAASMVLTVPLTIMVLLFQRRIVSGLTAGAVK
ncbi:MAG TPA: carbohydrate ABC transporter permease [Actinomycetota bacterium]|nr:carbohydrate ABC transporter permease [Actinomycetota bacterium]